MVRSGVTAWLDIWGEKEAGSMVTVDLEVSNKVCSC